MGSENTGLNILITAAVYFTGFDAAAVHFEQI